MFLMSTSKTTILVTGFGPFPGTEQNPAEFLAKELVRRPASSPALAACERVSGCLPTHWQKIRPALTSLLARYRPQIILHIGYAATSPGFHLEEAAYNRTCNNPDVDGIKGNRAAILNDGPVMIKNTLPLQEMARRLVNIGLCAKTSNDPGLYLCNMAYYLSLCHALGCSKAYPVARHHSCLFVHIPTIETENGLLPPDDELETTLSFSDACRGLDLLLEELLTCHNAKTAMT